MSFLPPALLMAGVKLTVDTSVGAGNGSATAPKRPRGMSQTSATALPTPKPCKPSVSPLYDQVNSKGMYVGAGTSVSTGAGASGAASSTLTLEGDLEVPPLPPASDEEDGFFDQFAFATPAAQPTNTNQSSASSIDSAAASMLGGPSVRHRHTSSNESALTHKRTSSRGSIHEYATSKSFFKFFKKKEGPSPSSPVSPVNSVGSKFSKRNSIDTRKLSPLNTDEPESKKRLSRSSSLLRPGRKSVQRGEYPHSAHPTHSTHTVQPTHSTHSLSTAQPPAVQLPTPIQAPTQAPKSATFEKLGPVGKLPSPVGRTIPVQTTSAIHFNEQPKLEPTPPLVAKPIRPPQTQQPLPKFAPQLTVPARFHPKKHPNRKQVLVTTNHRDWKAHDVTNVDSVAKFRALLSLDDNTQIFLTNVGLSKELLGDHLDALTLAKIVEDFKHSDVNYKFFVSISKRYKARKPDLPFLLEPIDDQLYSTTSQTNSLNSESSMDKFLSTPQYLIQSKKGDGMDYLNFKDFQDRKPSLTRARSITHSSVTSTPPPFAHHDSPPVTPNDSTTKFNSSSFRVIPPDNKFVDFDNKRPTPFASTGVTALTSSPKPKPRRNPPKPPTGAPIVPAGPPPPPPSPGVSVVGSISSKNSSNSFKVTRRGTDGSIIVKRSNTTNSIFSVTNNTLTANVDPFGENKITFKSFSSDEGSDSDSGSNSDDGLMANSAMKKKMEAEANRTFVANDETSSSEDDNDDDDNGFGLFSKKPESIELNIRPAPEVLYKNLEVFFPKTDLDKPIIDDGIQRMKSIRIVAQERIQNKPPLAVTNSNTLIPQSARLRSGTTGSILRRRSTKMWGQKVTEVHQGQKFETKRDLNGVIEEFAWVKGALIGVGKFGRVYIAMNITTGDLIAVKQMTNENKSFNREINSLKDLDHVNIVQYLGYEIGDTQSSIFLEYVSGGSIGHLLRKYGRLDEDVAKFLTIQMFQGLSYIHSKGLLHCDLKADNLLLETNGILKISDFGISKSTQDLTSKMAFQGTIFWMAPEIINDKKYDKKVDIWSSGCVLIEMFTGDRPWKSFEIEAVLYKLGREKVVPPIPKEIRSTMSAESKDFIRSCLQIDPKERPEARELLREPFCKTLDDNFKFPATKLAKQMNQDEHMESDKLSKRMKSMVKKM